MSTGGFWYFFLHCGVSRALRFLKIITGSWAIRLDCGQSNWIVHDPTGLCDWIVDNPTGSWAILLNCRLSDWIAWPILLDYCISDWIVGNPEASCSRLARLTGLREIHRQTAISKKMWVVDIVQGGLNSRGEFMRRA